jgi:uncharacterized protein DUF5683
VALVGLLSLATGPVVVHAQGAAAEDSTAAAPDSAAVTPAPVAATAADTLSSPSIVTPGTLDSAIAEPPLRQRRTLPQPGRFDRPRWVMLRSLLVPAWGQVHNRAWIKAVLVAVGDGALRVRFFRDERRLNELNRNAGLAANDTTATGLEFREALASGDQQQIDAARAAYNSSLAAFNDVAFAYNDLLQTSINRRWLLGGVVLYAMIDAYVDAHFKNFDINLEFDPALPGGTGPGGARLQIRWAF